MAAQFIFMTNRQVLFDTMVVHPDAEKASWYKTERMKNNYERYYEVSKLFPNPGLRWWLVAVIHEMECSQDFSRHLHNGDSLLHRTVLVPSGRPLKGKPPFTFTESAVDALRLKKADLITDWSIGNVLYFLEGYNGYGYAKFHNMNSPYLWSGSNHYIKGKYVADGEFDSEAVSKQIGVALLLKQLI